MIGAVIRAPGRGVVPGVHLAGNHHNPNSFRRDAEAAVSCWCEAGIVLCAWEDIGRRTYSCGLPGCEQRT